MLCFILKPFRLKVQRQISKNLRVYVSKNIHVIDLSCICKNIGISAIQSSFSPLFFSGNGTLMRHYIVNTENHECVSFWEKLL